MFDKPREFAKKLDIRINKRLDAVAAFPPPPVFLSVQKAIAVSVAMQTAICVSLVLHLTLALGVGFTGFDPNKFVPPHNLMDVVLVNAKSSKKPTKADALAQANLDGGGNTDDKRRAATPLPAVDQSAARNARQAEERVKQLEREMKTLMVQAKSTAKVLQGDIGPKASGSPEPVSATDLVQKSIEIARLEAQIAKEYSAYQERPRKKEVGGRTQEYRFATYVDSWIRKVERIGNLNYPEQARTRGIHGTFQVTVELKANGEVVSINIHGRVNGVLRDAVKRIVSLSAPFETFPGSFKSDVDILAITRTWIFGPGDVLSTETGKAK